jgi:hypothetical protein
MLTEAIGYLIHSMQDFRSQQYFEALKSTCYNLLGNAGTANILFVCPGDLPSYGSKIKRWPLFEYGHESLFFTKVLDELDFDETTAMWTNYDKNDQSYIFDLVTMFGLKIIALGDNVTVKLNQFNLGAVTINHPRFARNLNIPDYAERVKGAIDATAK